MAKIRTNLKQLKDADVRYISLVDRAATRIPFRVLKRDKESQMGIDLTSVFKSDRAVTPHVSALVVFAQKNDAAATLVREAIEKQGFVTDRVQKSDEGETLVFAQGDQPKETHVVRLSDQLLVSVAGMDVPEGWTGDLIEEHGFFPDLTIATEALHDQLRTVVTKSDTPQKDAEDVLVSFAQYLTQMAVLPTAVFKLDETIGEIVKKCGCGGDTTVVKEEIEEETEEEKKKKKRVKDHAASGAEMAPEDEDADQEPPPPDDETKKAEAAKKADSDMVAMLKGIQTTITGLSTKLESVVTEQTAQKKVLDEVVQKADTLNTTLKTTVTAAPITEDRPSTRMRIEKKDEDPRTGNFDTAFLRRRR